MGEVGAHTQGACPLAKRPRPWNIYCIDKSIGAGKTNSVMFMIIIHIAYITCFVTNDAVHAYIVIGVYKIHHGAGEISYFAEPAILWFTSTVIRGQGP